VVSFYFRSAGGAYKAAAEHQLSMVTDARESLTHPAKILRSSGTIIASLGGFYLDIFGSWLIAMGGFFICLNQTLDGTSFASLLGLPEVQWVLSVVGLTGVGMIGALVFIACRKNKRNIFLEVGYFIIGLTLIGSVFTTYWLDLIHVGQFNVMVVLMAVTVLGIIFFTHYLTSSNHRPIQFIARQAQYGSTNVLISSFFNGLVGNAVVTLILLVGLVSLYMALDMIGLMMVIIYGLSIIVVACNIKLFALISNQIIPVLDATPTPVNRPMGMGLSKMASSLEAIGNALSSVSGILTSVLLFLGAFLLSPFSEDMYSVPMIFGVGLGGVTITIFYAVSISGTYQTLMASSEEIQRQLRDIPLLSQPNKSHPNIQRLCDKHALNGLRAVTLPGVWIVIALGLMTMYLSNIGVYGVLIGMFMTVFVYSFFWSIFGDSVVAVFHAMQRGRYGGDRTSVFSGVTQAFLYAHYFQWVLAPTGVIIMKLAGMIALVMGLNEGGWL
jgi:K(+)-stimulated pyrophosphate-energized sodium pump